MKEILLKTCIFYLFLTHSAFAAEVVMLHHDPVATLLKLNHLNMKTLSYHNEDIVANLIPTKQTIDFNQTAHIRYQQTYGGYPVFGGEVIAHIPHHQVKTNHFLSFKEVGERKNGYVNGRVYVNLTAELQKAPEFVFSKQQGELALEKTIANHFAKNKVGVIQKKSSDLLIYIDKKNKAHFAFKVIFYFTHTNARAELQTYIVDAIDFNKVYANWNDIKTIIGESQRDKVKMGGYGGNINNEIKKVYDGLAGNLKALDIFRNANNATCYLQSEITLVSHYPITHDAVSFNCLNTDPLHNNIYWDDSRDEYNGGYSPDHDALYAGDLINDMFQDWYHKPMLHQDDDELKPLPIHIITHAMMENAEWNSVHKDVALGNGGWLTHPFTSPDVIAHELTHGFTEQYSNLIYEGEAGAMNEAFSDMTAAALEFYSTRKNTWQIGHDLIKKIYREKIPGFEALRYLDQPSKDCPQLKKLGLPLCSIDSALDYSDEVYYKQVHLASGVYNRAFYLLATTKGWDTKKAYDIMKHANEHYWIATSDFKSGACGVVDAARDYGYDMTAVKDAFKAVAIDVTGCIPNSC